MRVVNEASEDLAGSLRELVRLQTEFQSRLTEETIGYLRRLQELGAPVAPGTVLAPAQDAVLTAEGEPGEVVELTFEAENRQAVHCMVTPMLDSLVSASGVIWSPATQALPRSHLVAPGETARVVLRLEVPDPFPGGTYRGGLVLQGFRRGVVPVAVDVALPKPAQAAAEASEATEPPPDLGDAYVAPETPASTGSPSEAEPLQAPAEGSSPTEDDEPSPLPSGIAGAASTPVSEPPRGRPGSSRGGGASAPQEKPESPPNSSNTDPAPLESEGSFSEGRRGQSAQASRSGASGKRAGQSGKRAGQSGKRAGQSGKRAGQSAGQSQPQRPSGGGKGASER